jgi:hypothetical protein
MEIVLKLPIKKYLMALVTSTEDYKLEIKVKLFKTSQSNY